MRFQKLTAGGRLLYLGIITNPWHQTFFLFLLFILRQHQRFRNKIFGELRHCGDKPVKDRRVSFITLASAPKQLECALKGDRLSLNEKQTDGQGAMFTQHAVTLALVRRLLASSHNDSRRDKCRLRTLYLLPAKSVSE